MTEVVVYLAIFTGLGAFFLFFHLLMGKFVRPDKPEADKLTIYECGEPTIGSAWVQFDLRYYVVALLFVIFDVEVAFFFPWAMVFGKANTLSQPTLPDEQRAAITKQLVPASIPPVPGQEVVDKIDHGTAFHFAVFGFFDILIFFGVLLVGFAYLWKRGDINWIRTTATQTPEATGPPVTTSEKTFVHS